MVGGAPDFCPAVQRHSRSPPKREQHPSRQILREGADSGVEDPALLTVDDDYAAHLPRFAGLRPEAVGHGMAYLFSSEKALGLLSENYVGLPF